MPEPASHPESAPEFDYLRVDAFLRDLIGIRALASAFELGVIDHLERSGPCAPEAMPAGTALDATASRLLLNLLRHAGVVTMAAATVDLSPAFRDALRFRDLMMARIDLALFVTPDFAERFTRLLVDPAGFFAESDLFDLFDYQRAQESSPENYRATAEWMRHTTLLTRHEAAACMARHDFSSCRHLLDVGGNSGEFALQLCARHPQMQALVRDLPLVCELGGEHVRQRPEGARVRFSPTTAPFPAGVDLVTFKSMLHDWPEDEMRRFLAHAWQALEPGGTVLIMERSLYLADSAPPSYASIPLLLFFRAYRTAEDYRRALAAAGFVDFRADRFVLDMPFLLITARKPEARS